MGKFVFKMFILLIIIKLLLGHVTLRVTTETNEVYQLKYNGIAWVLLDLYNYSQYKYHSATDIPMQVIEITTII